MVATARQIQWVRTPLQARSQKTLDRMLDAAEALLEARSFEEISVADIAKKAKSSVGAFYARFKDKESLLLVLEERLHAEGRATAEHALNPEAWAKVPLAEIIPLIISFIVDSYREREGLRRAVIARVACSREARQRALALSDFTAKQLVKLLESRKDEFRSSNVKRSVDICHRIVFAVLDQHIVFHEHSPAGYSLSDKQLKAELTEVLMSYLGVVSPAGRSAGTP